MELEMMPEDVLATILMRVDIKFLIRLSCVCKIWQALIVETPYFGDKHLNYWGKNQDAAVFLRYPVAERTDKIVTYEFKNLPDPEIPPLRLEYLDLPLHANHPNMLVRHCNGILYISEGVSLSHGTIHLCNLTTLEHVLLPHGLFDDDDVYFTENLGFGFEKFWKDYKVIRIKRVRIGKRYQPMKRIEVYRLSTNSWSEVNILHLPPQSRIGGPGVFLNGFIHWWDIGDRTPHRMIVRFDLRCESFSELRCPDFASAKTATLSTLGNCLAVCTMSEEMEFKIWTLTRSGNEVWFVLKFRTYAFEPISYWFHDDSRLVFTFDDYVVVWPVQSGHVMGKFYEYGCSFFGGTSSPVFRPSLVSLRNRMISQVSV